MGFRVIHSVQGLKDLRQGEQVHPAVAIGNMDGVHLGHQALLRSAKESAQKKKVPCAVLTFSPHPQEVLRPSKEGHRLTTDAEKFALLERFGVDFVFALPFDKEIASQTPEVFFDKYVREGMQASTVHVGFDFRFGRARSGDTDLLKSCGSHSGIDVQVIDAVQIQGAKISSSLIRSLLQEGHAAKAAERMGRPYRLSGQISSGSGRGRELGVPTANVVYPREKVAPRHGVYATHAWLGGKKYDSITNFGIRPTFAVAGEPPRPSLETHLLDFSEDIYGDQLDVDFVDWVREERRFPGVDALRAQIRADIETVRRRKS